MFECGKQDFRVGVSAPGMPVAQLLPDLFVVVDFAVEDDGVAAGSRAHRLMSGRGKIEDRKSSKSQADAGRRIPELTVIVGTAMLQRSSHAHQDLGRRLVAALRLPEAGNAAHLGKTPCRPLYRGGLL